MSLSDVVLEASKGLDGTLGISVKHLDKRETASLRGDELFPMASVFKIPIIVELYRQIELDKIKLDEKVVLREKDKVPGSGILKELSDGLTINLRDLVELMMTLSDNTATDLLLDKVGVENVNATLKSLSLSKTKIIADCRDMLFDLIELNDIPDEQKTIQLYRERSRGARLKGSWALGIEKNNITTPREMLRLLEMIVKGKALSRESCDAILDTMKRCQTGSYRIAKYLPREKVEVADKTGALPGIRNDVGVVSLLDSGERYIISCFTKNAADNFKAEEVIANVSRSVYDYFTSRKGG